MQTRFAMAADKRLTVLAGKFWRISTIAREKRRKRLRVCSGPNRRAIIGIAL
jgi:hypothetical protein